MILARLWSATLWSIYAFTFGFLLLIALFFMKVDLGPLVFCPGWFLILCAGFILGFLIGGKTPEHLRSRVLYAVERECNASKGGLRILSSRTIPVGPEVTTGERLTEDFKAQLWRGRARVDFVQAIRIAWPDGEFQLIIPWSGADMLAHEFVSWLPGRLPAPVMLARDALFGSWGSGEWFGPDGLRDHPMAMAAQEATQANKNLAGGIVWNWEKGFLRPLKMELKWGLQAVPLERERFVHVMHTAQHEGLIRKVFGLEWYVERRAAFAEFVSGLKLAGKPEPRFFYPANSLLILHGSPDDDIPEVLPANGVQDVLPADE